MSTALYVVGFSVVIGGLAWGASVLGVPQIWIIIGVVILAGIAIMSAATSLERREPPPQDRR